MTADPKVECQVALKSIARDLDDLAAALKDRRIGYDTFERLTKELREKQLEILKLLATLCDDPVDRWAKVIGP